ncbi:glycosyltransferase family 2 protein [Oscillospiraceae bacterium HV4-5-C5C]|nr:glycosyltransferase family 2 protein [Oscillospiraceae bacterium HV4-5-C5C]
METKDVLYIVIPAYNEEDNIRQLLQDWYPVIQRHDGDRHSRLLLINDGSRDRTAEVALAMQAQYPLLEVRTKPNQGHGPSLIYGYQYALEQGAQYIFQTDADGQTLPEEFEAFWRQRQTHAAIFGNRVKRGDGAARAWVEKVLCLIVRGYFKVKVPDTNAPFRLMQSDYLKRYLPLLPQDYNLPNVMLVVLGEFYKDPILFLPITFRARQGGSNTINLKKIFRIGWQALRDFSAFRSSLHKSGG